MAKHVFSNTQEVCHAWANKQTDWGHNSTRSISFDKEVIYSYSTKMAVMHSNTGYILLNTRRYTHTTSMQQRDIYNAIPYDMRSKCIPIDCISGEGCSNVFDVIKVIKTFKSDFYSICEKLAKARKKEIYHDKLRSLRPQVEKYHEFLKACKELNLTGRIEYANAEEFAEIEALLASFGSPCVVEARARAYLKEKAEAEKARLETIKSEFETSLQEWREHKRDDVRHKYDFQDVYKTDFVRLSKDGKYFETHKQAKVPFNVGIQLFRICANIKNKCIALSPEDTTFPMSFKGTPFILNEVKNDGSCVVGCHRFSFVELNNMCKIAMPNIAFADDDLICKNN